MDKYELIQKQEFCENPGIRLKVGFGGIATLLDIGFIGDELHYNIGRSSKKIEMGRYTNNWLDTRLAYLTESQKVRLSKDTGIPTEEIEEISKIERTNQNNLQEILLNTQREEKNNLARKGYLIV